MASRPVSCILQLDDPDGGNSSSDEPDELPGARTPWGSLIEKNENSCSKEKHPLKCSLPGCTHLYAKSSANATKVGWHICGHRGAKQCAFATTEQQKIFPKLYKPSGKPAGEQAPFTTTIEAPRSTATAQTPPDGPIESLNLDQIRALQAAETERERMLESNHTSLPEMMRHVAHKEEARRLNTLWAKAFHHAGLPPNVVEDDYIRDAIFQTSKSKVIPLSA